MKYSEWTKGQWPRIISSLLGPEWADTRKHQACPCAPGSKDCYRFSDFYQNGSFHCRCSDGSRSGFDLLKCRLNTDFAGAVEEVAKIIGPRPTDNEPRMPKDGPYWQQVWNSARIVENSRYLASRHLATPPTIRFHKKVQYEQGTPDPHYPAMVCPFTSSTGRMMGVHVTFLGDGKKADCPIQRKQLTDPGSSGGAVRLFPAAEEMGVAEGIETALSASKLFGMPVWAALNTSLLKGFVPPPECKRIWIFGDHDPNYAGHLAAYGLAHRIYGKVEQIKVKIPLAFGDWNDVLIGS